MNIQDYIIEQSAFARPMFNLISENAVVSDGTVCQDPKWGNAQWWLTPGRVDWKSKIASHYWFNKILTYAHVPSDESVLTKNIGLAEMFNYVVNAQNHITFVLLRCTLQKKLSVVILKLDVFCSGNNYRYQIQELLCNSLLWWEYPESGCYFVRDSEEKFYFVLYSETS